MRTIVTKQPSNQDFTYQKLVRATPVPVVRSLSMGLKGSAMLQCKPSCACGGGCPRCQKQASLQTKLKISEPGDQYEQEADRIADRVMRMPETSVQRQAESIEEDETIHTGKTEEVDLAADVTLPEGVQLDDPNLEKNSAPLNEILALVRPQEQVDKSECLEGKVKRWGCDTSCSHRGFWDVLMLQKNELSKLCCNRWPPFVENYARKNLKLDGTASCKGANRRQRKQIATVTLNGKSVEVLCTDAFSSNDHEIELSPLAMNGLHGNFENINKAKVCFRDSPIETCGGPSRSNKAYPEEDDCVSRGCQSIFNKNGRKSCSDFGWPNN